MKILKINAAKNNITDLVNSNEMLQANSSLDACGCTGNGVC